MMDTVLLIIDVQAGLFSDMEDQPYNGATILDNIQKILEAARKINMPVVFVQHNASRGALSKGLPTWEICPQIAPLDTETVVEKATWDAFHNTNLHEVLQALGADNLIIVGLQTEFCVDTTCRRAFSLGYRSVLASDAHTTFDSEILSGAQIVGHHNNVLGGRFAALKSTGEIVRQLNDTERYA